MSTKNEQLDSLFTRWINVQNSSQLLKDGIVNEPKYDIAKHKLLFIEKESNDSTEQSWDYRTWWRDELLKYRFTYRIAEWAHGILNDFEGYERIWENNQKEAREAINQIAFMNIKKSGGGGNADYEIMMEAAKVNLDNIHRQIDIIDPEMIITGFTWGELRELVFPKVNWDKVYDVPIGKYNNAVVIDFYHPSAPVPASAFYSLLKNIVQSEKFLNLYKEVRLKMT